MVKIPTSVREREAAKLKDLFVANTTLSHGDFAKKHGFSRDAMVWQYLNNHRPLNVQAAAQFASGLGVLIGSFSSRLESEARQIAAALGEVFAPSSTWPFPDIDEQRFEALTAHEKIEIQGLVRERIERFEEATASKHQAPSDRGRKRA